MSGRASKQKGNRIKSCNRQHRTRRPTRSLCRLEQHGLIERIPGRYSAIRIIDEGVGLVRDVA